MCIILKQKKILVVMLQTKYKSNPSNKKNNSDLYFFYEGILIYLFSTLKQT